jgi:hypothetical protein
MELLSPTEILLPKEPTRPFKTDNYNDFQISQNHLRFCLITGKQVEADKGYTGEPLSISVPSLNVSDEMVKTNARMRHANVNQCFKISKF